MTLEYEWSDWIEHDGSGCPCVGEYIREQSQWHGYKRESEGFVKYAGADWDWSNFPEAWMVRRYRIRRPRVAEWLQTLTALEPVDG